MVAAYIHQSGKPHGVIHTELRRVCGGPPSAEATAGQLERADQEGAGVGHPDAVTRVLGEVVTLALGMRESASGPGTRCGVRAGAFGRGTADSTGAACVEWGAAGRCEPGPGGCRLSGRRGVAVPWRRRLGAPRTPPDTLTLCFSATRAPAPSPPAAFSCSALFGTAAFAPLPFSVAAPGLTVDVLGKFGRTPVITVSRVPVRVTTGQLRMVTIQATGPSTDVHLGHVIDGWFRTDRAVMPREAVYPSGGSETEIERHNLEEMKGSQASAIRAALHYVGAGAAKAGITLRLADVGGPSAGLLFSLGIVDKLRGDGAAATSRAGRSSPVPGRSTPTARSARSGECR